jgi:ADP-ribose pyrophosphatase YjhB (NUDIX family)
MGATIDLDTLERAIARDAPPSSDFDLNPGVVLPPGRKLRPAAVLIPVLGAEVILTKRASHLKHHPGQIAFPGGKVDEGDADARRRRIARSAGGDRPRPLQRGRVGGAPDP